MTVDQNRRPAWFPSRFRIDQRMEPRSDDARVPEADAAQVGCQPRRASLHVRGVAGLRADRGEADEFFELAEETRAMAVDVGEGAGRSHEPSPHPLEDQAIP